MNEITASINKITNWLHVEGIRKSNLVCNTDTVYCND